MEFPKQIKDIVYNLLQEPTLDKFREFFKNQTGEHDTIDFKDQWIEKSKLAKEMIAIANVGGGIIVFGIHENKDHSFSPDGIEKFRDKTDVFNEIKDMIPSDLKYDIYDFDYNSSEYEKLENHKYQMIIIEDTPKFLPFMAKKDSKEIKRNRIYVRRGTSVEEATQEEIQDLVTRRINSVYPDSGKTLNLNEHLEQLQTLYNFIRPTIRHYEMGNTPANAALTTIADALNNLNGKLVSEKNPYYPEEDFEVFISRMISEKKTKIEKELDLR